MREENMEDEGKIERVSDCAPGEDVGGWISEPDESRTTGWFGRSPIERDLGPRRGELQPERIAAFLAEFTAVSKKYGIIVSGEWDSPDLLDMLPGEAGGAYVQGYYTSVHWEAPENAPTSA